MSTATPTHATTKPAKKGFFGRMFDKLDASMKAKAEQEAKKGGCCCGCGDESSEKKDGSKCC